MDRLPESLTEKMARRRMVQCRGFKPETPAPAGAEVKEVEPCEVEAGEVEVDEATGSSDSDGPGDSQHLPGSSHALMACEKSRDFHALCEARGDGQPGRMVLPASLQR